MIPVEALRAVKKIVVHANCADGKASAMILHEALPDSEIVEVAHATPEHRNMVAEPDLLFCDMTPPRERVAEFVDTGTIVLDHHKGAEDIVRAFGDRGVFADESREPGVSGAMLALLAAQSISIPPHPLHGVPAYDFACMVGVRDTWQRASPRWDEACALAEYLRFMPLADLLDARFAWILDEGVSMGRILLEKTRKEACDLAKVAHRLTIGSTKIAIVPTMATSDVADVIDDADVVVGFAYQHDSDAIRLKWSLRSRGGVDVKAIASRFGGGGHTAAAGFSELVCAADGDDGYTANPYRRALAIFKEVQRGS